MNKIVRSVTKKIIDRSKKYREKYLSQMIGNKDSISDRSSISCGNIAHAIAGCSKADKNALSDNEINNIGIVTAYNDMLSAHKTYENYPEIIRNFARKYNCVAQVSSGVPAMCDGVTQGEPGMDLSLFSRDVIALSTVIGLSHNVYNSIICLGICDKIVPGLLIGALKFGHLPTIFVPGGPMQTGISNELKAKYRKDFAKGLISKKELLKAESKSYHSEGTCTFYGTANSNQMLMEIMGIQLPGSSFVNPNNKLRLLLTEYSVKLSKKISEKGRNYIPLFNVINEKSIVNAIIGLLSTGGSTNHTIHLIAIAKAAGIQITWNDFSELSSVVPLLLKIYPNGSLDVNHFHDAGGMPFLIQELLNAEILHNDVNTILGNNLYDFTKFPSIINSELKWENSSEKSKNPSILRTFSNPFSNNGGIKVLNGNLGKSIIKISSVKKEHLIITAPIIIFEEQHELISSFQKNNLNKDFIAVLRFQGPKAKGMPELHKLTPILSILLNNGYKVALITDGRMSGASGRVPAAIHLSPEAMDGGLLSKLIDGDIVTLDATKGILNCHNEEIISLRKQKKYNNYQENCGRELFNNFKKTITSSDEGASILF
ncbi:MAG: phosphogluconate dehydratase [Flavobacteriales bacterium]|nr:phosphogluconate dehydratase [Flavobacteriales bacterium]|tara:strand:- start:9994 stop:11793 length:1800 start_codon:yes stop_codon:yes gene_type:complete